ncbi:tyrosine-type recombinase/integrase [Nonomuraea sp. NPDC003214]
MSHFADRSQARRMTSFTCMRTSACVSPASDGEVLTQAEAVLTAAEQAKPWLSAYVTLSPLTGARTEELRELAWSHVVAYDEARRVWQPVIQAGWEHEEFAMYVWRSVRATGDTKTPTSRRTLQLPHRCVRALVAFWEHLADRDLAPSERDQARLVFATRNGTTMSAGSVRREFRRVIRRAGLVDADWTPRKMRHSFVSLLSADGVPVENIARLIGHAGGSAVTEKVYRHQIRPVIQDGATVMDRIFPGHDHEGQSLGRSKRPVPSLEPASELVGDTGIEPVTSSV